MASKSQITTANKLLRIIQSERVINKFDLMDKASIGLDVYNKISAWFKHRFEDELHQVEYDKKSKTWRWCEVIEIEQEG